MGRTQKWLSAGAGGTAPPEVLKRNGSNRFVNSLLSAVKRRNLSPVNNIALTTVFLMLYRSVVSRLTSWFKIRSWVFGGEGGQTASST